MPWLIDKLWLSNSPSLSQCTVIAVESQKILDVVAHIEMDTQYKSSTYYVF